MLNRKHFTQMVKKWYDAGDKWMLIKSTYLHELKSCFWLPLALYYVTAWLPEGYVNWGSSL